MDERSRLAGLALLWARMSRRKQATLAPSVRDEDDVPEALRARSSLMKSVLTLTDLTLLGVGATLGTGVYILAGQTAYEVAGPAVVLSFLIAAVASLLAALCYAELASVVPTAGTAYSYSYVGVGEFLAFFVGWNLLLEYAIATASVARAFSNYVDAVSGYSIRTWSLRTMPLRGGLSGSFLAEYPGLLALALITLLAVLLSLGVKESSLFNNVCTLFNLATIIITVVAGAIYSNPANWSIPPEKVPDHGGEGGFFPFGVRGMLAGAARCFFGYVGFDTITACGEEAKNPRRNIPLSILLTLAIIFVTYLCVSVVATMMVPYYAQDVNTPFPSAFQKVGLPTISWIVAIGGMFAMCTSMVGSMLPLPRVLLTMASDGMLFRSLAAVSARTGTSLRSTLLAWALSGSMALLFNLEQLIDMMSIGTLTAYIVVAVSVVQLRYSRVDLAESDAPREVAEVEISASRIAKAVLGLGHSGEASAISSWVVTGAQVLFLILCVPASYLLAKLHELPPRGSARSTQLAAVGTLMSLIGLVTLCISLQPRTPLTPRGRAALRSFRIPCVPLIPYISILVNMSLMMMMNWGTWTRFGAWLLMGFTLYFLYSIDHSTLEKTPLNPLNKPTSGLIKKEESTTDTQQQEHIQNEI